MSTLIELKVPDIGGHSNVDVIEVFIKAGDSVAKDDALVTLETDKATMDVPADAAGVVKEVKIAVGSKVSEGDVIALIEASAAAAVAGVVPAGCAVAGYPPARGLRVAYKASWLCCPTAWPSGFQPATHSAKPARSAASGRLRPISTMSERGASSPHSRP